MSLWKNQHLKYVFGALLLITYTSPQTLSAKWFDDLRDFESLEKYSYAKARSYKARADAFNQGAWAQRQFSKLAELWTCLPMLYLTPEESLVSEHNIVIDKKIRQETEKAQREGRPIDKELLYSDEMQHWTKDGVINSVADQIIRIKLNLSQQKKSRPRLVTTQALTDDYRQAKHDQYMALYDATRENYGLSSLYLNLAKAWENLGPEKIGAAKFEILKFKYEHSTYIQSFIAEKKTNDKLEPYPYFLPDDMNIPFYLRIPPDLEAPCPVFKSLAVSIFPSYSLLTGMQLVMGNNSTSPIVNPFLWPVPLKNIEINTELIRLAGNAVLPETAPNKFYWKIKRFWFSTTKEEVSVTDKKFWRNHLFYSDYLKSTFGISTHESLLVIEELMI